MEIKVDAESVNKYVVDAILKSALGLNLEKAINKALETEVNSYNSTVHKMCSDAIRNAVQEVLTRDYHDKIVAMVAEQLTSEHVNTIVKKSVENAMSYLKRDY